MNNDAFFNLYYMKESVPFTNIYYQFLRVFGFGEKAAEHSVHTKSIVGTYKRVPV